VEKILEGGVLKTSVFLVNLSQNDGSVTFKSVGINFVIGDFAKGGSELGRANVSHDVGVVLEDQDFLS